jgi:ribonuclease I
LFTAGLTITIDDLERAFPKEFKNISKDPLVRLKLMCEGIYSRELDISLRKMDDMKVEESFKIPTQIDYHE